MIRHIDWVEKNMPEEMFEEFKHDYEFVVRELKHYYKKDREAWEQKQRDSGEDKYAGDY